MTLGKIHPWADLKDVRKIVDAKAKMLGIVGWQLVNPLGRTWNEGCLNCEPHSYSHTAHNTQSCVYSNIVHPNRVNLPNIQRQHRDSSSPSSTGRTHCHADRIVSRVAPLRHNRSATLGVTLKN